MVRRRQTNVRRLRDLKKKAEQSQGLCHPWPFAPLHVHQQLDSEVTGARASFGQWGAGSVAM
jgi:hypothetical protein